MTIFHYLKYGHFEGFEKEAIPRPVYKEMCHWYGRIGMELYVKEGTESFKKAKKEKYKEILLHYDES
jgi:hypothetical protein